MEIAESIIKGDKNNLGLQINKTGYNTVKYVKGDLDVARFCLP